MINLLYQSHMCFGKHTQHTSEPLVPIMKFPDCVIVTILYGVFIISKTLTKLCKDQSWPQGYKNISCSTQLRIKFFLLINVKMLTIVGILAFINRKIAFSTYLSLKKAEFLDNFILMGI